MNIREIIRNKWDTRRKYTVPAPLCTLCCEISQFHRGETSFFIYPPPSPTPPPPFIPFLADPAAARARHSPLPYNRLINQYNIFTERDSSERYCQYRETLSKASNEGREGGEEESQSSGSFSFSTPLLPLSFAYTRGGRRK